MQGVILLSVIVFCLPDKIISQSNRQCIDNPTGALNVDVRGVPGPQGPRGEQGPKGSTGERGLKGNPGMRGERGLPGDTGTIGTTGNKGETGGKGQKGSRGIQGPIGPTGRLGLPGPQGIQGEPGDTVLNGEEFDRVCERVLKKLNVSVLSEIIERIDVLNTTLNPPVGERTPCGIISTNWRRIAYFDTTRGDPCPSGLHAFTNTTTGQRACGTTNEGRQRRSLNFTTGGSYTHVCGRVRGYQGGNVVAFFHHGQRRQTIDTNYVDGVSITRGTPRQHLWTYAAGLSETVNRDYLSCRCARSGYDPSWIPSFIGNDYYCESGFVGDQAGRIVWEDPLWDGKGCFTSGNTCCDRYGWFHRQVPPTTDDIEVRWCKYYDSNAYAEILTDQLEIWVM